MDYSDRMLRRAIEKLPDGTYEADGHIDGFVDHPDPAYRDLGSRSRSRSTAPRSPST